MNVQEVRKTQLLTFLRMGHIQSPKHVNKINIRQVKSPKIMPDK